MVVEIHVPDIGADEVEVTEVLVNIGDKVEAEQSIITVEGNKASMEVPAPFAGTVKELKVNTGDKVNTGSLIMIFEIIGDDNTTSVKYEASQAWQCSPTQSSINQSINLPYIDSNKLKVTESMPKMCGNVSTNSQIMVFDTENAESLSSQDKDEFTDNDDYVHATPVIRRLARELGVKLAEVEGTGRKGRILLEDIQAHIKGTIKSTTTAAIDTSVTSRDILSSMLPWPKVDFTKFGDTEEVELGRIRKLSGANLQRNWMMIPHVTQFGEADITELEVFRKQQNADIKKKKLDVKITLLVFIMKAVAKALEELPCFNSSLSEDAQKLIIKKYINISVAVDTPNGLVVPVFRNVNKKGITELSRELIEISKKARTGKLILSDMQGGCFTISNLGCIGGTTFTPIINAPEIAILGVSKSLVKPVWNDNDKEFAPRLMLPLSLSYDHRVIDGADGARFINFISDVMSDIRLLLM